MRLLNLARGLTVLACLVLPAAAQSATCEKIAGRHHGTFDADKRADVNNSGRPNTINGTWFAMIDAETCAMTGEISSDFTGKVALKGTYGLYNPDTSKFSVNNMYLDASGNPSYDVFALGSDAAQHSSHYVQIQTGDYEYDGSFDGR